MFAGIIEETALVRDIARAPDRLTIIIVSHLDHEETKLGDSIAIDGVCLTVVKREQVDTEWHLSFDLASETVRCTTFSELEVGGSVHLERSLVYGDRVHGHLVSGHVDGVSTLLTREEEAGGTVKLTFSLNREDAHLLVPKGSVAILGTSLTVGEVESDSFSVYIIPHTGSVTKLTKIESGDKINIEFDGVAKYLARYREIAND